jgi:magnesium transporter
LPWLVLALLGGFITVRVLGLFEGAMLNTEILFTPLIAAMAGNVECSLGNNRSGLA